MITKHIYIFLPKTYQLRWHINSQVIPSMQHLKYDNLRCRINIHRAIFRGGWAPTAAALPAARPVDNSCKTKLLHTLYTKDVNLNIPNSLEILWNTIQKWYENDFVPNYVLSEPTQLNWTRNSIQLRYNRRVVCVSAWAPDE